MDKKMKDNTNTRFDMTTLHEGDYVKVLSNKPAFHILTCHGGIDIKKEEVEPEEMVCIVNYVIDGTCCYVTTVSPNPGSSFVACQDEVFCKVDPMTLTEEQRKVRLPEPFTAVNGFDNDRIPEAAEAYDKCIEVATKAVKALFPEAGLIDVIVMGKSTFSHRGLIDCMDFFLKGIAAGRSEERKAELTQMYEEIREYVIGRKFRDFYEARVLIGESYWMIPVSYDFRKAFVCRDFDERTRFWRYLGGEYQDAANAVDHFTEECCKD